ncbi:MAG: DevR family CRISPR-associated autoregulator [bacterium JZ-2024 1]
MMSIALSFRIEANFQALNNEGSGGANVMEPRRITVGNTEYDGVSGEIVRRHILENFVRLCQTQHPAISLHDRCAGLVPDRGKEPLKKWIEERKKIKNKNKKKKLTAEHYPEATAKLITDCALCDIGGYLIALQNQADKASGVLKRDSCFEVGWLISEHPQILNFTQHSAYHETQEHNLFTQNMRAGIYAGVIRIDLYRIGFNDWWWISNTNSNRYAVNHSERLKRVSLLLDAIEQFLLSLSGARTTGWLPHPSGLLEGVIVTSTSGPAPFASPIKLCFDGDTPFISPNPDYIAIIKALQEKKNNILAFYQFAHPAEFAEKISEVRKNISFKPEGSRHAAAQNP